MNVRDRSFRCLARRNQRSATMMESKIRIPPPAHPPMAAAADTDPLSLERDPLLEEGVGLEVDFNESEDRLAVEVVVGISLLEDVNVVIDEDGGSMMDEGEGSVITDVADVAGGGDWRLTWSDELEVVVAMVVAEDGGAVLEDVVITLVFVWSKGGSSFVNLKKELSRI